VLCVSENASRNCDLAVHDSASSCHAVRINGYRALGKQDMKDPIPSAVESIPIRYFLVEHASLRNQVTTLHLLDAAEVPLLRCLMTMLLMPAETGGMVPGRPPFAAAVTRLHRLPVFRKVSDDTPPRNYWVARTGPPKAYTELKAIVFNGGKAQTLFRRHVERSHPAVAGALRKIVLPSTSPTPGKNVLPFEAKVVCWKSLATVCDELRSS
jgi:hypothetical protein